MSTFRVAAWAAPIAYGAHVAEEAVGGFPAWMRTYVAPGFAMRAFVTVNVIAMTVLLLLTALATATRRRPAVALYLAWTSALMFWNALVHLAATMYLGVYSPGTVTAVLVYVPSFAFVVRLARRERLLTTTMGAGALAAGAGLHGALGLALARGALSR